MLDFERINRIIPLKSENIEFNFFLIEILFLASAPFISCLVFIYPILSGFLKSKYNILKDRYNQIFILVSIILITKSIFSFYQVNNEIEEWTNSLNWAGIANWVPLFICSVGLNKYLNDINKRKLVAKYFIAGTIPVLISCIGQYWFQWYGPFEIFNGLIKWFQRPLSVNNQNVTGLFSNPNYTGAWLTMMCSLLATSIMCKVLFKRIS